MAGQVGKLTLEAVIKGFEDVQGLGKALNLVDKSSRHTDKSISQLASKIKAFATQNVKTTDSLRGQIQAFTQLRKQVGFNSNAYKEFSKDINTLNQDLTAQLGIEKKLETQRKFNRRTRADFTLNQRLNVLGSDLTGEPSKQARRIKELDFALGELNEEQLEKLGLEKEISVQSDTYRRVVEALTDQTDKYSAAVNRQKLAAAEALAMDRQRHSLDKERLALDTKRFKNFRVGMGPGMGSLGQISTSTMVPPYKGMAIGPSITGIGPVPKEDRLQKQFQGQPWIARFLQSHIETSNWQKMQGEKRSMPLPLFTTPTKTFADNIYDPKSPTKIFGPQFKPHKSKFGLQEDYLENLEFPKTEAGYGGKIAELSQNLKNLTLDTDEYRHAKKLLNKTEKEFDDLLKKSTQTVTQAAGKTVNLTQKLLPPSKQSILEGQAFKAPEIKKVAKSVEELTNEFNRNTKVGKTNINTLTKQRSRLEKIRNELDPTSAAFKRTTKAIQQTDKALLRLNNNKFSGANLRRTGQSILGAGFVGGPAGFLGAGLGAGIEALRPGGDMAGGAITGGLVASQVLTPVSQAIGGATTYASDIEKANIALRGITKTTENYDVAQRAIRKAVEDYNVPQEVAIKGMTRLSAAVLGAGGNIHNATEAFLNTTVAIKGTAGSADDVKSAITAMVQIFSKGKVSAEELSGQLGERFPAAVTKFAKANDISTQELQKNLKNGTVGLDMLSKFITSLGDEYEPLARKIAASNEEAGARSQIAMNKMRIAVGNALKPIGAEFQVIGASVLQDLIPTFESLALIASTLMKPLVALISLLANNFDILATSVALTGAAFTGLALSKVIVGLKGVAVWLGIATVAQNKFNFSVQVNPYVIAATSLAALILVVKQFGDQFNKTADDIKDGLMGKSIEATKEELVDLNLELEDYEAKLEKLNGAQRRRRGGFFERRIEELKEEIKARKEFLNAEEIAGKKKKFDSLMAEKTAKSPFAKFAEELKEFDFALEQVAVNGFKKLEDALVQFAQTGKLAFSDLVTSVLADLQRLMIRQTITRPLFNAFTSALTGGLGGGKMGSGFSGQDFMSGGYTADQAGIVAGGGFLEWSSSAKGNTFAKNGIVPYAKGGVIRKPTLSMMGEQGAEAVLPLQRGRGGRLGVAMQGGGGGTTNVNYTGPTLNFNGDEYVPKSAVGEIVNAAAAKGESKTITSLRNSRSRRASLGL